MNPDELTGMSMGHERTATVGRLVRGLLGCEWGRRVWTPDDNAECPEQAVQMLTVHGDGMERTVKLCDRHRDRVLQETTPSVCRVCGGNEEPAEHNAKCMARGHTFDD